MIITIASGKGGTGKTTLALNLAEILEKQNEYENGVVLLDCDVEAPNDKLFMDNVKFDEIKVEELKPVWHSENCKNCGKCKEVCRYNAIARLPNKTLIFKELCHSCGACHYVCPNGAIEEEPYEIGKIFISSRENFQLVYGELNIGETSAPKVVKAVKNYAKGKALNIIDAPPGTGCSVVAALQDSDFTILVTEPTPFGLHDLRLAAQMVQKLGIPFGVVINRSDGNDYLIERFLTEFNIPLLGRIPFDRKYAEAYSAGKILVNEFPEITEIFKDIYKKSVDEINSFSKIKEIQSLKYNINSGLMHEKLKSDNVAALTKAKEIMIISGKGGTGKTTVSAAFSYLARKDKINAVFEDCDVDASDLHLLLKPSIFEKKEFSGGKTAEIISEACNSCGLCVEHCRFDAIEFSKSGKFIVNEIKCEGCGLCLLVCPHSAVIDEVKVNGYEFMSETEFGFMSHAELGIAEENSGKLVSAVKKSAEEISEKTGAPNYIR